MPGLAALIFATPLFGLSLTPVNPALSPTSLDPAMGPTLASLPLPVLLQADDAAPEGAAANAAPAAEAEAPAAPVDEGETDADGLTEADRRYAEEVARRRELGTVHRAFGIATWGAMTITTVLGFIQYYNLYGVAGTPRDATPCVTGSAVFGQDQCWGTPWPHLIAALTTTALYTVTFSLSLVMPDPNDVDSGPGEFAERIRIHQALRWVHLVGMVAQMVIGVGLANGWFGDRANDYNTLEILAGVHQAIGWTTWGVLTAAGAMMLF
jgi:hypothetical protein